MVTTSSLARFGAVPQHDAMFCVDQSTAAAIRRAFREDGDLSAVIEFQRHFPLMTDYARALECARAIAG